jgi:hypothetical protein
MRSSRHDSRRGLKCCRRRMTTPGLVARVGSSGRLDALGARPEALHWCRATAGRTHRNLRPGRRARRLLLHIAGSRTAGPRSARRLRQGDRDRDASTRAHSHTHADAQHLRCCASCKHACQEPAQDLFHGSFIANRLPSYGGRPRLCVQAPTTGSTATVAVASAAPLNQPTAATPAARVRARPSGAGTARCPDARRWSPPGRNAARARCRAGACARTRWWRSSAGTG